MRILDFNGANYKQSYDIVMSELLDMHSQDPANDTCTIGEVVAMEFAKTFSLHICGIPSRTCKIIHPSGRLKITVPLKNRPSRSDTILAPCFYQQLTRWTPKTIIAAQKWKRHKSFNHCFSGVSCWFEGLRTVTLLQKIIILSKPLTKGNKHLGDLLGVFQNPEQEKVLT